MGLVATAFLLRAILVLLVWLGFAAGLRRRLAGSRDGFRRISIGFLVVLAPTLSIASWDWAMSLEPEWYSTMYGVTFFASAFASGIAAVIVLSLVLEASKVATEPLTPALRHDVGKLLFAFSCFWAYVWFCEYLLIWYANIPEEASHFAARQANGWTLLFWLHPFLSFVVPFVVLMPVGTKRSAMTLFHVAVAVLVGHWIGAFLMVHPALGPFAGFPIVAVLVAAAVVAGMALFGLRRVGDETS